MESLHPASSIAPIEGASPPETLATLEEIREIPKSELHLHLGGSWPEEFLIAHAEGDDYAKLQAFRAKTQEGMDYDTIFDIFQLIGNIVNSDKKVKKGATALCKSLAEDNVTYAEIRTGLKDFGEGVENHLVAVLDGLREGDELWGTHTPLILSLRRNTPLDLAVKTVELAIQYRDRGIVGIDISGNSTIGNSESLLPAIQLAQEHHLPIVLHLGESKNETEEQQVWELNNFAPTRVGHGVLLHPEAEQILKDQSIPLEICLRSSELAGMTEDAATHPGLQLYREGHPVCVCTDDPMVFKLSLSDELYRMVQHLNLTIEQVKGLQESSRELRLI